jgi:polyisoprenoid-binding protein YceI
LEEKIMACVRFLIAGAMALASAGAAAAQPLKVPADPNPAAVESGAFAVEPIHTRVLFSVSHMGFTTWYGNFNGASGSLVLSPKELSATHLDVSIPIASITTTNAKLDGELKGPAWLDTAHFPTARFVSRKIMTAGPRRADVLGDLTLHGVTRPMTLHVVFNGAGLNPLDKAYTAGFDAHGVLSRSAFGVTKYVPLVGDKVDLIISAAFERKSP